MPLHHPWFHISRLLTGAAASSMQPGCSVIQLKVHGPAANQASSGKSQAYHPIYWLWHSIDQLWNISYKENTGVAAAFTWCSIIWGLDGCWLNAGWQHMIWSMPLSSAACWWWKPVMNDLYGHWDRPVSEHTDTNHKNTSIQKKQNTKKTSIRMRRCSISEHRSDEPMPK